MSMCSLDSEPKYINQGKEVFYQGSRQMTNVSRRYYERELGAGLGPSPSMKEHFGYSEPLRRFIQRESFEPQANEIPNSMPSWLRGRGWIPIAGTFLPAPGFRRSPVFPP